MKQKLLCLFLCMVFTGIYSQSKKWNDISNENHPKTALEFRKNTPSEHKIYSLNFEAFKNTVFSVSRGENKIIEIPTEKGIQKFYLQEASNFSSELSDKFPMIKSYIGKGIDDISASVRFSIGTDGLHAVVYVAGKPTFYVDPYTKDKQEYIAYSREKLPKQVSDFECEVKEQTSTNTNENLVQRNADDGLLRTYRLAIVCSGEYAQYHLTDQGIASSATDAVKKAAVLSAMNTSMTRINGVYERDLGVHMEIVANNDEIIFLDASTDNITDGDAGTMINEVQAICDATIGDANYDIGHIFSIGGSGLAGLGVVCVTGQKGRGVTGIATPKGDPYDIDYVAHEMGHQFGANHTQNNPCNSNSSTAVEPGSASTIMGYAGICAPNVQSNSDDHFHSVNIDEMWATIQSSASCATTTTTGNTAPTADAGLDYTVPKSTPLILKGIGRDVDDGNVLTYNWEQTDNETATMPPASTNTVGPLFRSNSSVTSPNRYLPALTTVVAGNTSSTWEVIPSVAREMNFSFLVRDNNEGGGNSARDDMKVTVDANAGPFVVTSQAISTTWYVGTTQSVTWDVAGTDAGTINVATVNILLSTDGGLTFPITLATAVANDGLENISVPEIGDDTTTARILIEANENIFYAVNSANFSIEKADFIIDVSNPIQEVCLPETTLTYTFTYETFTGFTGTTNFSASDLPSGVTDVFSSTSASVDGTEVSLTLSGINSLAIGSYPFIIKGTSGSTTKEVTATFNVYSPTFEAIILTTPLDEASLDTLNPELTWEEHTNATSYDVEIASNEDFTTIIETANVTSNTYTILNSLDPLSTFYWRIRAKNSCATSEYSLVFSFTTSNCTVCESSGNTNFATSTTLVKFNSINKTSGKPSGYSDYTTTSTVAIRNVSYDLSVNVNTDGNYQIQTKVWIDWNQNCSFDDDGEEYNLGDAANISNGLTSLSPLAITIPLTAKLGNTTMRVSTKYLPDGSPTSCEGGFDGEVEDYTIIVSELNSLPSNISVTTVSESCVDLNDGTITVNAEQLLGYTVTVIGGSTSLSEEFSASNMTFTDLVPGIYEVCVSANDFDYTQCFEVTIEEVGDVSLRIDKNQQSRSYAFNIESGTAPFDVFLNNKPLYTSNNRSFDLEIQNSGVLEVKTAKDCEGVFTSVINDVFLKQNPVADFIELDLPMGIEQSKIDVTIFDVTGKLVFKQAVTKDNTTLRIPFGNYNFGVYILHLGIDNVTPIKILKK